MKGLIISILLITLLVFAGALIISPPKAEDIEVPKADETKAGLGEVCSNPTFTIPCAQGLTCLSLQGEEDFDPQKKAGYCRNATNYLNTR